MGHGNGVIEPVYMITSIGASFLSRFFPVNQRKLKSFQNGKNIDRKTLDRYPTPIEVIR